jgi:glutamate transport system permease protein
MTAPVLADALGPRARRRAQVISVVAGLGLAAALVGAVGRLADNGQLDADRWRPFTDTAVLRFLVLGLLATLKVAAVAMSLAVAVGAAMALGRLARNGPLRWLSGAYVEVFRALPLLLLIFFSARGLPRLGLDLDVFWYLVLGLVAYNGAVLGEIFRAGILSLERGQTDAALAIGLGYWQTMFLVVVPQAVRRMVPAIVSQLVTLLKDTSLGFVLPYEELLRRGQILGEATGKPLLQALFVVAGMYIVVNLTLSRLARRLEVRQRRRYKAGAITVSGIEDLAVMEAEAGARL